MSFDGFPSNKIRSAILPVLITPELFLLKYIAGFTVPVRNAS